ncbi:MAG: glycosyltransferase 87 family protein [Bacteroidales bacterium]
MVGKFIKGKPVTSFAIFGLFIIGTIFFVEKLNNRFWLNDFKVMYLAADAFLNHEQIYGTPFGLGTGFFKYSPFTMLLFIPYTIFSFDVAAIFHFFISGFCAIGTVILLEKIIRSYLYPVRQKHFLTLSAVMLCGILHLVRELHLGNINMILLFLLCLSLYFVLHSKPVLSGLLLGLVILAKPYFIICLLPVLVNKRYKEIFFSVVSVSLFVLSSIIISGLSNGITLYQEWISAMMDHSVYLISNHTVFALINTYFGITINPRFAPFLLILLAIIISVYFWTITNNMKDNYKSSINYQGALIVNFFLIIALIPSILITDTEHFLFSLPLIAIILFHLKKEAIWPVVFFVLLILIYEGNSSDLLGNVLSGKVEEYGVLGISNLIIIMTTIYWVLQNKSKLSANIQTTAGKSDI